MAPTKDDGAMSFPYPILTKAGGKPTALWVIVDVEEELMANAMSVPNPTAAEACWSRVLMTTAEYAAAFKAMHAFDLPAAPGKVPQAAEYVDEDGVIMDFEE